MYFCDVTTMEVELNLLWSNIGNLNLAYLFL